MRLGRQNGLTDADIERLGQASVAGDWPAFDAALVRATDELYRDAFISDATWAEIADRYDTHQMMDLVLTVGAYQMLAMALGSFGVQLQEGSEGFPQ